MSKEKDPYWSERERRVHSSVCVPHPALHCMLEGKRSSVSHRSTFSRSRSAWLCTTPHKCSSSRIRDASCDFWALLSSLFHEIMCNLSATVCDWIAVILSLPWFQKQKAKKTLFFSAVVCFEGEDWQRQNNTLRARTHTRTYVHALPVAAVALRNWEWN